MVSPETTTSCLDVGAVVAEQGGGVATRVYLCSSAVAETHDWRRRG